MRTPQFKLTTILQSELPEGNGETVLKQRVTVEEFSDTPQEHVWKNMEIAGGIMGIFGTMADSAMSAKSGERLPWEKK